MNTYLPKISKFISAYYMESVPAVKRWHFYGYFLLAFIFYSTVYSVYGDTGTTATDAANTAVQFPVAQPALPTPIVVPDLNGLINVFQDAGSGWQKTLIVVATNLFYLLAAIEIAWTSIRLTLRQADLGDWTSEMVYQIMFIGFFYMLLINSVEWSNDIIQSFRMAGQAASLEGGGTNGVSPTIIFNIGYNMASKLLATVTFVQEGDAFFLVLSAFIILICAALIAAFMILVLIETYFAIYAGIIFMGFGGSRFTSQIAVKTLQYTLAAGGKLFFVQLLGGLIEKQMILVQQEFLTFTTIHNTVIFKIIGIFIICVIIVKRAPEILQSMLNGINFNFTFLPPASDTGNTVAPAPVNSTTTLNTLTSAAAPSGYTPPLAGMFNTAAQNIPAENIGNRLLDVANTTFHTAAFSESGSISADTNSFGAFASPAAPSSQANAAVATPNMPNTATNVDTGASSTRAADIPSPITTPSAAAASVATPQTASPSSAATSQVDNQNTRDAGSAAVSQTAAGSAAAANATANRPDTASANNMGSIPADGYQSAGLGGRFGDAGSGAGPNIGANAPDQANQLNQPGQASQNNQDVASSTSPLSGQQKMTAAVDTDMPKDSNQGGENVSNTTSALGGQQNQPQQAQQMGTQAGDQANGADATKNNTGNTSTGNTTAATTETLKSPSEANDKAASSAAQSAAAGSVNQSSAAGNPSAATTPAAPAPGSAASSPAAASASPTPGSAATSPAAASASPTPGSAATSPAAASASPAPGSAATSPAAASASTAPGSAATSPAAASASPAPGPAAVSPTAATSTAPGPAAASPTAPSASTAPGPAAAPATAATSTPPGNNSATQKTVSTSEGHKNPAGKSTPSPVDDKNKAADKNVDKNQSDDKSKKLKDILEDKKDKKNKPDDPDLDDDSFEDKPKKPKYPKGDHHDEK